MTVSWNIDPGAYFAAITRQRADDIEADIVAFVDGMTDEVAAWMRDNARWTDRTGEARQGLYADIEHVVRRSVHLLMSHGPTIEYAVWLEWAHAGRFSILPDAVDNFAPVLYRGVLEILRRHSY